MSFAGPLGLLGLVSALGVGGATRSTVDSAAATVASEALAEYRWFHAHPELSEHEVATAAHLAAALGAIGLEVHEGIGGHGIVALLRSPGATKADPVVLYRADMDGLPVEERTGLPYASRTAGVMHACGHDVHMATAIGALWTLSKMSDWKGTVIFVGQPAEEVGKGARAMLADKRFRQILKTAGRPSLALALHDTADLPAGEVSIIEGYHHANVDSVDIVIHGKGGHGARPHETVDPIVVGAEIVLALQTIVSRRIRPDDKAVITVGSFSAGTKHNIIPSTATLLLTVRSYEPATRELLKREIERVARNIAKAHRTPRAPDVRFGPGLPAAFNEPAATQLVRAALVAELGASHVHEHPPSLGGEDFGLFGQDLGVPAVMWQLGAVSPKAFAVQTAAERPGLHSDRWAPAPEPTLRAGIRSVVAAIVVGLQP